MFGYVKPYTNELKVVENEVYKGIYCGLCKQLGKKYGPFSRLILNYDFAFMSLLSASLSCDEIEFKKSTCIAHPLSKRTYCISEKYFEYPSAVSLLMLKYKLSDNFADKGFKEKILSYLAYPFLFFSFKKAQKKYPETDTMLKNMIKKQQKCEAEKCPSIDIACEETALAMSQISKGLYLGKDETQKRVLERFGYLLGRFVYMIDATDDLQSDFEKGNYNPFIYKFDITNSDEIQNIVSEVSPSIYLTIGEIIKTFELLDIKRFKGIIENIVYMGLKNATDKVVKKTKKEI